MPGLLAMPRSGKIMPTAIPATMPKTTQNARLVNILIRKGFCGLAAFETLGFKRCPLKIIKKLF